MRSFLGLWDTHWLIVLNYMYIPAPLAKFSKKDNQKSYRHWTTTKLGLRQTHTNHFIKTSFSFFTSWSTVLNWNGHPWLSTGGRSVPDPPGWGMQSNRILVPVTQLSREKLFSSRSRVLGRHMCYVNSSVLHSKDTFFCTILTSVATMAFESLQPKRLSYALAYASQWVWLCCKVQEQFPQYASRSLISPSLWVEVTVSVNADIFTCPLHSDQPDTAPNAHNGTGDFDDVLAVAPTVIPSFIPTTLEELY